MTPRERALPGRRPARRGVAIACALALAGCVPTAAPDAAAPAATWTAYNTMRVVPDPSRPATAAVISRAQAGPSDFWCAAGDYAMRRLGAAPTDRVTILRGRGPSPVPTGREAVVFTTDPPPALAGGRRPGEGGSYALSIEEPGFNLSAAQARGYCPDSLRKFGLGRFP